MRPDALERTLFTRGTRTGHSAPRLCDDGLDLSKLLEPIVIMDTGRIEQRSVGDMLAGTKIR